MSRERSLLAALGAGLVAVLVVGLVTTVRWHGGDRSPRAAAERAADAYYAAVHDNDAKAAYGLLCAQERNGYTQYAAEVAQDHATGTGVATFRRTGAGRVRGSEAAVPARIVLDDGVGTPIVVLLARESGHWLVCSSDLGGVLPPPGPPAGQSPTPT
jgi:hypothetical protein